MKKPTFIAVLCLLATILFSQTPPEKYWQFSHNRLTYYPKPATPDAAVDWLLDVHETHQNPGFIACGFTSAIANSNTKVGALVRLDENGVLSWEMAVDNGTPDIFSALYEVIETHSEYVAIGRIRPNGSDNLMYAVKVDFNGNILPGYPKVIRLHAATYPNIIGKTVPRSIRELPNGGFIVAAVTQEYSVMDNPQTTNWDLSLIKFDQNFDLDPTFNAQLIDPCDPGCSPPCNSTCMGLPQVMTYGHKRIALQNVGGPGNAKVRPVIGSSGTLDGFALTSEIGNDVYVVHTDAQGNTLWDLTINADDLKMIGNPYNYPTAYTPDGPCIPSPPVASSVDFGRDIQVTQDGHVVVSAALNTYSQNCPNFAEYLDAEAALIKIDMTTGNIIWAKQVEYFSGEDFGLQVKEVGTFGTSDYGFVVMGSMAGQYKLGQFQNAHLVRTDGNGVFQWRKGILGDGADCGFSVDPTDDGGYIVCGNNEMENDNFVISKLKACPDQLQMPEIKVTGNLVWDFDRIVENKVVIQNGASLTIKDARIQFGPKVSIEVLEGGSLFVDGATLTSTDCGLNMWDGIRLEATVNNQPAFVSLDNFSTIEHAHIAVHADADPNNLFQTTGTVKASQCTFTDNRQSVVFGRQGVLSLKPFANPSTVSECIFTGTGLLRDQALYPNEGIASFIEIISQDGIDIQFNKFQNDPAAFTVDKRGNGIVAAASAYNASFNEFTDLSYGIQDLSAFHIRQSRIDVNSFSGVWRSILSSGTTEPRITRNTINIGNSMAGNFGESYGIYLEGSTQYHVEENTLTGGDGRSFGIYVYTSGFNANEIYRNSFDDTNIGIQTSQTNDGLVFKCNEFANFQGGNDNKNIIVPSGTIAEHQGSFGQTSDVNYDPNQAANNLFSGGCGGSECEFEVYPGFKAAHYEIKYYYNGIDFEVQFFSANEINIITNGLLTAPQQQHSCETQIPVESQGLFVGDIDGLKLRIQDLQDQLQQKPEDAVLESQIRGLTNERQMKINWLVRQESAIGNEESMIDYLMVMAQDQKDPNWVHSSYLVAPILVRDQRFNEALDLIDEMPMESDEMIQFRAITTWLINNLPESKDLSLLSGEEETQLRAIATTGTRAGVEATNLLRAAFGEPVVEIIEYMGQSPKQSLNSEKDDVVTGFEAPIELYPNPSSGVVMISFTNAETNLGGFQFVLFDVTGNRVFEMPLKQQSYNRIDFQQLSNGLYFYQILNETVTIKSGKINLIK